MYTSIKRKGTLFEEKVANLLYKSGYIVYRAPASGSATKRPVPDLLVIKDGKAVAIELAYRSRLDNIKIHIKKVKKMHEFVEKAKVPLFLCVKYSGHPILCIDYNYLFNEAKIPGITYVVVTKDKILKQGIKLLTLLTKML